MRPDGVFVVGSGVDVALIKAALETATSLPVNASEEPEAALACGAALASANAPLFGSSTAALAHAHDPRYRCARPVCGCSRIHSRCGYHPAWVRGCRLQRGRGRQSRRLPRPGRQRLFHRRIRRHQRRSRRASAQVVLAAWERVDRGLRCRVVALVIALAISVRPTVDQQPGPGQNLATRPSRRRQCPQPRLRRPRLRLRPLPLRLLRLRPRFPLRCLWLRFPLGGL